MSEQLEKLGLVIDGVKYGRYVECRQVRGGFEFRGTDAFSSRFTGIVAEVINDRERRERSMFVMSRK